MTARAPDAQNAIDHWYAIGILDMDTANDPRFVGEVSRLVRSAQVAAHEADAKAVCGSCRHEKPHRSPYHVIVSPNDWWHDNAIRCHAGLIWDTLSKLRESEAK